MYILTYYQFSDVNFRYVADICNAPGEACIENPHENSFCHQGWRSWA